MCGTSVVLSVRDDNPFRAIISFSPGDEPGFESPSLCSFATAGYLRFLW